MIGQTIGQYEVKEIIGQGGMATVYKAYHSATDRHVAVKVLTRQLSQDPRFLARFRREARVIARLEHRSIVPIYDYGEHDGMSYIVMRLIENGTLRNHIFHQTLDMAMSARIIEQVGEALDYGHTQGVIHRDLKPSNILLDMHNNAYLTDFGIAKMVGSTTAVTSSGVVGTPSYMSPEQCQGKDVTPASDIYALGAILFEIMSGDPPYVADTPLAVMYMHVRDPIPSLSATNQALPRAIDPVIQRALAKKPQHRYESATALARDFWQAMNGAGAAAIHSPAVVDVQPEPEEPLEAQPVIEIVEAELVDEASGAGQLRAYDPASELEYISDVPDDYQPRGRDDRSLFPRGLPELPVFNTVVAVSIGLTVLLAVVGIGLLSLTALGSGGGGALAPTLPPTRTPGGAAIVVDIPTDTPVPTVDNSTPTPVVLTAGPLIEPTDITPATATGVPLTPTPTKIGATATRATPSITPTPTSTPTLPTATPTLTGTPTLTLTLTPSNTPPLSGVSGLLVYTAGSGSTAEIAVIDANGQNPDTLTSNNHYDGEPDWTATGSKIAYEAILSGGGNDADIYVMNADGSNIQQLTTSTDPDRHPDWSPDASKIAFERGEGDNAEIYVMDANGGNATRLTTNSFGDRAPQFSPDGTQIAFMTEERGKWEIAIMDYPSGAVTDIFDCPAEDCRFPTWSPDGTKIAYNTLDAGGDAADVYLLTVSTGQSALLLGDGENGRPVWSGNGAYIFLNRTVGTNTDLYRIRVDTVTIERLTTATSSEYGPDWGP